ncbi:MAG: DUF3574 domain-containing protein [Phenylobacterium sp.]|nr:MAG: DUF3574 domain-containing protein [Phenylobacterium sp.]
MRRAGALLLVLLLAGCASVTAGRCPVGQERLRTAQFFFGHKAADRPGVSEAAFRKFVDEELTTRFPDGLTVLDGGGQWQGRDDRQIRDAAKVVLIVLPKEGDARPRLDAVRQAYKARFAQDPVVRVTQPSCVPL